MKKIHLSFFGLAALAVLFFACYGLIYFLLDNFAPPEPMPMVANAESRIAQPESSETKDLMDSLQEEIQTIDATHLIRKYHQHLALLDVKKLLQDQISIAAPEEQDNAEFTDPSPSFFQAPEFEWPRLDNVRPLDVMRLTFRGNGIPKDADKLAESGLLEPKLQAFYDELAEPNTTIWISPETVHFDVVTHDGKTYDASSTPFISLQPISKSKYAKMNGASLPFLWRAYSEKEAEANPVKEGDDLIEKQPRPNSISGITLDSNTIQSLYLKEILAETKDPKQADLLRDMLVEHRSSLQELFNPRHAYSYLNRLAQYDPEFSSLFLLNNLFDQYNLFSVFKEGVSLRINAIDTKLNVAYISYNIHFDPPEDAENSPTANTLFGCNGKPVNISDEYFLILTESQAYLMRVYLPDCKLVEKDYALIDNFVNHISILNDTQLSKWRGKQYQP